MTVRHSIFLLLTAATVVLIAVIVSRSASDTRRSPDLVSRRPESGVHDEHTQLNELPRIDADRAIETTEVRDPVVMLPKDARTTMIEHPENERYVLDQHVAAFESSSGVQRTELAHAALRVSIAVILTAQGRGIADPGEDWPSLSPEMPPQDPETTVDPGAFMTLHTRGRRFTFMRVEFPEYAEINDARWRSINSKLKIGFGAPTEEQEGKIRARIAQALALLPVAKAEK